MTNEVIKRGIIEALTELHQGAQTNEIYEKVKRKAKVDKRTVQRGLKELVDGWIIQVKGYYVYSLRDKAKLRASLFGGHAFYNLWLTIWQQKHRRKEQELTSRLVDIFGVYMIFVFLEAAHPNDKIRSYEDRIDLLHSMIPLKLDMYYKFVELLRGKSIRVVREGEDQDTLDLNEEIITTWSQRLKKQFPELYTRLESSAELARSIVK